MGEIGVLHGHPSFHPHRAYRWQLWFGRQATGGKAGSSDPSGPSGPAGQLHTVATSKPQHSRAIWGDWSITPRTLKNVRNNNEGMFGRYHITFHLPYIIYL